MAKEKNISFFEALMDEIQNPQNNKLVVANFVKQALETKDAERVKAVQERDKEWHEALQEYIYPGEGNKLTNDVLKAVKAKFTPPPERSVSEIVEEFSNEWERIIDCSGTVRAGLDDWLTQTLKAERQKREETVEKWNELYGNAKYSPEMVLHEFNVFIQPINPK